MSEQLREEFELAKKKKIELRSRLQNILKQKNDLYSKVKGVRDKINSHTKAVQGLTRERDSLTDEVRKLKSVRDGFNAAVKVKADAKKNADQKKGELRDKSQGKENPGMLRQQIARLEKKMETEALPFDQEQKLMKILKDMKAKYKKIADLDKAWKEVNAVSADFSQVRRQAQDAHHAIQQKAEESQQRHEQITLHITEIKKLREEEKPIANEENKLRSEVDGVRKELGDVEKRLSELRVFFNEEETKSFKQVAREKTEEVKEKLKKGQKLSMSDILAFLALDE